MSSLTETRTAATISSSRDKDEAVQQLLKSLGTTHTLPLWAQMSKLNPPLPNPQTIPHVWKYDEIRPQLLKAGELITEKQAERRVLMLCNPARRGSYS
jgi:gentisate 1,2-dioxygenase